MKKYIYTFILCTLGIVAFASAQFQPFVFINDLRVGSTGTDVAHLQTWLISKGYDIPALSSGAAQKGYFGSQTKVAVMNFQAANGVPNTGFVGPMTRGKLNNIVIVKPGAPVIRSINAPTQLTIGEQGTVSITATDPGNKTLSYRVTWGDEDIPILNFVCPPGYSCEKNPGVSINSVAPFVQKSTFSHAYTSTGTYTVTVTVVNSDALETRSTVTIRVNNSNANPLKVISPNGGETWYVGDTQTIRWNSPNYIRATYADIRLVRYSEPCTESACPLPVYVQPFIIVSKVNMNQNSYSWNVGSFLVPGDVDYYSTPVASTGRYFIQICETGTTNCTQSREPFTIAAKASATSIRIDSPNGSETWESQSVHQIKWTMLTNDKKLRKVDLFLDPVFPPCSPTGACPAYNAVSYILDKNIAQNAIYNWIVATDIVDKAIPTGSYKVRVCVAGSTTDCDMSDAQFTITPRLLRVCPDQKILNLMPYISDSPRVIKDSYYLLNSARHEIAEFDANWVTQNCRVPEESVY